MKKLISTFVVLLATVLNLSAQSVFISPETGHLIAAVTYDQETGFENGFSALWRHDQLSLNLMVADDDKLTDGGEIANPAGNLNIVNGKLTITGGQSADCFLSVSLPKGYRFTGYSITLDNDLNSHTFGYGFSTREVAKTFYETGADFNYNSPKAQTAQMPRSNDTRTYTINRQASSKTDMGNRLYFRLHKDPNVNDRYYGVSIRSFVVYFSADAVFDQPLQALPFSTPVGVAKSSFMVGKPELGTIKPNTKNGVTYYSFDYRNVDDLEADFLLYQANAVAGGKTSNGAAATKTITRTINRDGLPTAQPWFALAKGSTENDNTYYVETPVSLTSATGKEFPIGYRITGAKLEFALGQQDAGGNTIGTNRHGEVAYLHGDCTMGSADPETRWQISGGNLTVNGTRLYVTRNNNGSYSLTTSSRNASTATFSTDRNNRVVAEVRLGLFGWQTEDMYIHEPELSSQPAVVNSDTTNAAKLMPYPAFTPSANGFTATVFDKTGNAVAETAAISSANTSQTIELTDLNNDAIKFKVDGLSDGSQALVRVTLTMQHLNPYIHSIDVIGRDANDSSQKPLTHNFTADNFSVRGGHFVFNVPEGSASHTWNFEFDNLTSNYTDATYKSDTYTGATDGNARVAFVESKYFKANEDLYAADYNPDYAPASDKLQVVEVGTVPFRFNNADQLANSNKSAAESQLEEYPFSVRQYQEDTGYKDASGRAIQGQFKQVSLQGGQEHMAYIFVSDETRYNIAPTTATQHRYYAHYIMDIELQEKVYPVNVDTVKVYDKTFYTDEYGHEKESSMWGLKVSTTEAEGYANLSRVLDKITELIDKKQNGLESGKQILYVDLSSLQSIMLPAGSEGSLLMNRFREMMAPNCLFYLPNNTADKINNFAHRPEANGSFTANANIVLTDKQPFFAPYDINVPSTSYAKYTREVTHSSTGKSNLTTLVLPFQFTVSTDGTHTNDNEGERAGDGKTFTLSKLAKTSAISTDKGESLGQFNNDMASYDNYVHFDIFKPATGKSEAYKPYMVYIDESNQLEGDENFSVLEYGADVKATPALETAGGTRGNVKIADEDSKSTGTLAGEAATLTPMASMAGCKLAKNTEKCLYFSADRFRSSWTLTDQYDCVYMFPFRSWFDYIGTSNKSISLLGVAFGNSGEATGIEAPETDGAAKHGTYRFVRNGQLYIRTDRGVFTADGRKVNP